MFVSMIELMRDAREKGYGIPACAVENEHSVRAVLNAAVEKDSPVILISLYKVNPDINLYGRIVEAMALRANVPVALCQDHGATYEEAMKAIHAGFTDVMVDRSALPFDENVAEVTEIVKAAHACGVGVEAELGHVGVGDVDTGMYTEPDQAARFCELTGCDALAVAIGTTHGVYKNGNPHLEFGLLEELREKVPVPLVLHGGSGTGDEALSKASKMGITKLNISNDLKKGAISELVSLGDDLLGMGAYQMYPRLTAGYQSVAAHYMDVTGSTGKASNFR